MEAETKNIVINPEKQTNWYVITGGPSSGKTTVVNQLNMLGYHTTIEHARHFIDSQMITGKTPEEIKKNRKEFQLGILDMQILQESSLSPDELVFLDRAVPDALAYYRFLNLPVDKKLDNALKSASYKKIFILDFLPLVNDYARSENAVAQKEIQALITGVYESLPFPVIHVPVLTPEERADFILKNL